MAIIVNGKVCRNLQEQVEENSKDIVKVVEKVNALDENVTEISSDIVLMKEDIESLYGGVEDAEDDIDRLKDRMTDAESAIYDLEVGSVTLSTDQTITGTKTFTNDIVLVNSPYNINPGVSFNNGSTVAAIQQSIGGDLAYVKTTSGATSNVSLDNMVTNSHSTTTDAIAKFDSNTGKTIADSGWTITGNGTSGGTLNCGSNVIAFNSADNVFGGELS